MKYSKFLLSLIVIIGLLTELTSSIKHKRYRRSERGRLRNKFMAKNEKGLKKFSRRTSLSKGPTPTLSELNDAAVSRMLLSKVLVDIQIISLNQSIGVKGDRICTYDYELVLNFSPLDNNTPTDLNEGAGGSYLYMCAKYLNYLNMGVNDIPINTLEIQVDNSNCGDLKGDEVNLNDHFLRKNLYLCRGQRKYDVSTLKGKLKSAPIKKLYTYKSSSKVDIFDYFIGEDKVKCLKTDLNLKSGGKYIFVCYSKYYEAPMVVDIQNLTINANTELDTKTVSATKNISEFIINNGDTGSELSMTISREKTSGSGKSNELTKSKGLEATLKGVLMTGGFSASLELTGSINWSSSSIQESTASSTNETSLECVAPAGKFYKCYITDEFYDFKYAYSATKVYTEYSGKKHSVNVTGISDYISKSKITAQSCCYFNCKEKEDIICNSTVDPKNTIVKKSADVSVCDAILGIAKKKKYEINTKQFKLEDFGITDVEVVVDIRWTNAKDNLSIECPDDEHGKYVPAPYNLREGSKGDYVSLCLLKKKISEIPAEKNMINVIRVQYLNNNCGSLQLAKNSVTNESDISLSSQIYICFGIDSDPEKVSYPIVDIQIINDLSQTDTTAGDTIAENLNGNLGTKAGKEMYIKVLRNPKIPKKVKVEDYKVLEYYTEDSELPTQIDTITAVGSTITKTITTSTSIDTESSSSFDFGLKIGLELQVGVFSSISIGGAFNYNRSSKSSTTTNKETVENQEIPCTALPGKTVRCIITKNSKKVYVKYSFNNVFYDYKNQVITSTPVESTTVSSKSDSVSVATCCVSGCCPKVKDLAVDSLNEKCLDDENNYKQDLVCEEYTECMISADKTFQSQEAEIVKVPEGNKKKTLYFR